ncbi:MAG: selenide, water dikinase SelD [Chitinophagaceae bacterium]
MSEPIRLTQFSKGGGCGCKIAPSVLQQIVQSTDNKSFQALLVGNDSSDDAAVYIINEETAVISTTDFFLPIVDDPFQFGQIAAANAISDVYAMGGTPLMAVAILGWPIEKLGADVAQQVLAGGKAVCEKAGIPLAGGHTIDSQDPIFGLAVTGTVHPKHLKKNNTAQEGDVLFLTKPLGTGILATAVKRGVLDESHYEGLLQNLTTLNSIGAALGKMESVHAITDVTGFGLLGHLLEMAEGSGLGAQLYYNHIQKLTGVETYLQQRITPDATFRNWNSYSAKVQFEKGVNVMEAFNLLPDPQTNGGLLIAVEKSGVKELQHLFTTHGLQNHLEPIGVCTAKGEKTIVVTNV